MSRNFVICFAFIVFCVMASYKSENIEIELNNLQDIMGGQLNKFDPFSDFDRLSMQIMDEMEKEEDQLEITNNENSNAIEIKDKVKKTRNRGTNAFQTIQITEVHVIGGHQNGVINFGMPGIGGTIIVTKPRNLKMRGEMASPFKMMQEMDNIFESMFESLAGQLMQDQIIHQINQNIQKEIELEIKDLRNDNDKNDNPNDGHIVIKEIKDISSEAKLTNISNKEEVKETDTSVKGKHQTEADVNANKEEHGLTVSYNTTTTTTNSSTDKIMTAKEKKKQVKEEKKRLVFVKICKFVFYLIILFTIFILIKRLLQLLGLIQDNKADLVMGNTTGASSTTTESTGLEMKATNIKTE